MIVGVVLGLSVMLPLGCSGKYGSTFGSPHESPLSKIEKGS